MRRRRRSEAPEAVRFAVIGQGHFLRAAILPAFPTASACELTAVFTSDELKRDALTRRHGPIAVLGYDDYEAYLRSGEVDAVYVALPSEHHADYAVRAARAGVHVLCEKPLAPDSETAERIEAECRGAHVKLMVAYRVHLEAATIEAIERATRGDLGRPRLVSATVALEVADDNLRTRRAGGGGPLLDLGISCVAVARAVFRAEPTSVVAVATPEKVDDRFAELEEQVAATLVFPGERLAQLACSFGAADHSILTIVGTEGLMRLEPAFDARGDVALETQLEGRKPRRKVFRARDRIAPELTAFARCVLDDADPEPNGLDAIADLRVLDAIQRAIASRRPEAVEALPPRATRRPAVRRPAHGATPLVRIHSSGRS